LHRAAVGPFADARAVTLEALEAATDRDELLLPVSAGLAELAEIRLDPHQANAIRHGNPVLLTGANAPLWLETAWASFAGKAVALGRIEAGHFKPDRVIL
jgi:tRNA pseudouridine55 synthase